MITKTEVIIVFAYDSVRMVRVTERRRHKAKGPHRSPTSLIIYNFLILFWRSHEEMVALHI